MRDLSFSTDCYYHIYNRGVEKRKIFEDRFDYWRFLETLEFYRKSPVPVKLSDFRRGKLGIRKIETQTEIVKIHCFCLMPNHFHLIIQQISDKGISVFMRKISDSFTKYFNTKHERVGSLFQGPFKAKLIETDEYLLQLSKYIHRNPKELKFPHSVWEGEQYPYSSYKYYISVEKHSFCDTELILSYFSKTNPNSDYQSFVEKFGFEDPSLYGVFIDPED